MKKKDIIIYSLLALSCIIIVFGILFLLSAAEIAPIFTFFKSMNNVLVRYIIVILTMAVGIMTFSNVASRLDNKKLSNGLSIGITTFSTILTIPLVYVFIAIFFAQNGKVGPVGEIMMLDRIVEGFNDWFGSGTFIWVVYSFMLILSLVFIAVPIITCIDTVKKNKKSLQQNIEENK